MRQLFPDGSRVAALIHAGIPAEALSDLVRLELLRRWGGVWVDATVYCVRPLDDWLPSVAGQGFFAFERPAPDRMVATWFIAAWPDSPLVTAWRRRAHAYWRHHDERDDYFWAHRLFAEAYESEIEFQAAWDAVPKLSAGPPHLFAPYQAKLYGPATSAAEEALRSQSPVVLKLTHKLDPVADDNGTLYRWLCERETLDVSDWAADL